jgi:hypothetical protein
LVVPASSKSGLWPWLLRIVGLESWFQQAPAAAHAGREERIVLLLTLAGTTRATRSAHATLLANACRECQPQIGASGGTAVEYQPGTLLLTWPATAESSAPVVALYFQLLDCVRRLAALPALRLNAAAGLGWAAPGVAAAPRQFEQASLREIAGLLHESQQLGSELLLTAALQQRLAPAAAGQCALHVAFEVPGHRYPATVYRVLAPGATSVSPEGAEPVAEHEELMTSLTKKYSH